MSSFRWEYSKDGGKNWTSLPLANEEEALAKLGFELHGVDDSELKVGISGLGEGFLFRCVVTGESGAVVVTDGAAYLGTEA